MATGQSSVSSESIERTKQQIRGLVGEIAQLSKSDLSPEEYYAAFLQRVVAALAAVGGAVWTVAEGKKLLVAYQINLGAKLLDPDSEEAGKHQRLLEAIAGSNQPQLIPPQSSAGDERLGGNPTRQLMVVAPLGHDGQVEGLVEVFQRPDTAPNTQRGYLRFLVQMCELAGEWLKNRRLRQLGDKHSLWAQADQFARAVHDSLDLRETSYTIVNEGRRLLGVDRVTVGILRGGHCKVEAISGQDTLDNRSNVVANLGRLATRVLASGEPLWYQGSTEDLPPQIESALDTYVDESHTRALAVLPLRRPRGEAGAVSATTGEQAIAQGEIIGALIVEQIESEIPREVLDPRLELVFEHSARALSNALDHNNLFLMPVWKTLGKAAWVVRARTLPRTLAIAGAVLTVLLLLAVFPWNFDMKAKGELQPTSKREIFAPLNAEVEQVLKDGGDQVEQGELLVLLRDRNLDQQLVDLQGKLKAAREQYNSVINALAGRQGELNVEEKIRLGGRQKELEAEISSYRDQEAILLENKAKLEVRSPIKGQVITWDARKHLENRPVQRGQTLLAVADAGSAWEVDVFMPERRSGHVNDAWSRAQAEGRDLKADFVLMTDPGTTHYGKVVKINEQSEVFEQEGSIVKIRVALDPAEKLPDPRPGATLKAGIKCGYAPIGYVWFHEAWEWLQTHLFF